MTDPYGTIETLDDGRYVLRYDRRLRHPVDKVWAALTDPARVEEWLARAEVELAEGGRVRLEWLNRGSSRRSRSSSTPTCTAGCCGSCIRTTAARG
jgi:hypothetical protein